MLYRSSYLHVPGGGGVHDVTGDGVCGGMTTRVSVSSTGGQANGGSTADAVSANGRYVLFDSQASNLVAGDSNGTRDVFLRDRVLGKTFRVSIGGGNRQANEASYGQALSTNARFVVFLSHATNLVTGDTNGRPDVFVRDRRTGQVHRVSIPPGGAVPNARKRVRTHLGQRQVGAVH